MQLIGSNLIKVTGSWLGSCGWGAETQHQQSFSLCNCLAWFNKWTHLLHYKNDTTVLLEGSKHCSWPKILLNPVTSVFTIRLNGKKNMLKQK